MAGMILVGWLTDRMHRPLLLGSIYLLRGLSFILLINLAASADYGTLILFAVAFGVVDYSTVPVTASLVESHIGLHVMGLAMGLIAAGHSVGAALGAFLGGYLFDLHAQYDWVWISSIVLAVLAGLLVFTLRDRGLPMEIEAATS
jgi:MFS family permease